MEQGVDPPLLYVARSLPFGIKRVIQGGSTDARRLYTVCIFTAFLCACANGYDGTCYPGQSSDKASSMVIQSKDWAGRVKMCTLLKPDRFSDGIRPLHGAVPKCLPRWSDRRKSLGCYFALHSVSSAQGGLNLPSSEQTETDEYLCISA